MERLEEKMSIIISNTGSETSTSHIAEALVSMLYCNYETSRQTLGRSGKVRKQQQLMYYIVKETYGLCKLDHPDVKFGNQNLHN